MSTLLGMDSAKEQARAHRFNAEISRRNALRLDYDADWSRIVAGIEKQDFLDDAEKFNAYMSQKLRAKGGVRSGEFSALDVYLDNIDEQEQDVQRMEMQAIARERGIREQAINARMDSELNEIYASQAISAGRTRAFGTLVGYGFKAASLLRA